MKIVENSERLTVNLLQEPAAFPDPDFTWHKDGELLTSPTIIRSYSNLTLPTIRRENAGNYSVSATNFILGSSTEQVGYDTGSFYLDVICKSINKYKSSNHSFVIYRWTIFLSSWTSKAVRITERQSIPCLWHWSGQQSSSHHHMDSP